MGDEPMSTALPEKPPALAIKEALDQIAATLATVAKQQHDATQAMQRLQVRTPDTGIQTQLAAILDYVQTPPPRRMPWYLWPVALTLVCLLGVGVGWHTCGCPVPLASPTQPTPAAPTKGTRR
jgi:hypothetical protein